MKVMKNEITIESSEGSRLSRKNHTVIYHDRRIPCKCYNDNMCVFICFGFATISFLCVLQWFVARIWRYRNYSSTFTTRNTLFIYPKHTFLRTRRFCFLFGFAVLFYLSNRMEIIANITSQPILNMVFKLRIVITCFQFRNKRMLDPIEQEQRKGALSLSVCAFVCARALCEMWMHKR